jgi:hypothetical protein
MVRDLRACGCTDIDASEALRQIEEAERAEVIANAQREAAAFRRSQIAPMPGIPIGKPWKATHDVRANERAEEPRRLPSGHYAMPGIPIGRAWNTATVSASERREPRSRIVDNGTLPIGMHRIPGLGIGGAR